ncbi:MAG: DUF433 domain-containing protein [Anaerolineae bacterium]|nr:DUF433 domain-containing protein [Anaerolineae bacterium]MCB0251412.1 DUF433 domain-containing protein [Anaerolineae bacterium]MCB9133143.1 DUF433 domain-containing protein [Anaerolineales bacterium]MCB9143122.1 DUF433 domain-containing protein [Anaerolineales bacterium]
MARYPLNLPVVLKQEAEQLAADQGVSLNQFILWAVSEKVGSLRQQLDDPAFPQVTYRRGASGMPVAVVRGTGLRVEAVAIAVEQWGLSPAEAAAEYGLAEAQIADALAFSRAHRAEIEASMAVETSLEATMVRAAHVAA